MDKKRSIRPKQYTHIDYIALLIYIMKNYVSMEQAMNENGLSSIAKSTITRNLKKIESQLEEGQEEFEIIQLYKNGYLVNMQKNILPTTVEEQIENLPDKEVVNKEKLEDLYKKLSLMHSVLESCDGNMQKAVDAINNGGTPLGSFSLSYQAFAKNMKRYEVVKVEIEKMNQEKLRLKERE